MSSLLNATPMLPALYHVTLIDCLPSIMEKGLTPQFGERSQNAGETVPRIYFFASEDDMEQALLNWLGEEFEDEAIVVLEVRLPKSYLDSLHQEAFEVQCEKIIPPQYIQICPDFGA